MQTLAIGTLFDERFRILATVGEGGIGVVYKAEQLNFNRIVALKVLQTATGLTAEHTVRLQREVLALTDLHHPGIISAYEFGIWKGFPYATMQFIEGKTLQSELSAGIPLTPNRATGILQAICSAIATVHTRGIVHRDLKPGNIMLVDSQTSESVKIIDFGLARILPESGLTVHTLTEAGTPMGSILYMSPEQWAGSKVDLRSDIYSLGAILHHCLTGSPPFIVTNSNAVFTMTAHLHQPPPNLAESAPGITFPEGIQNVIYKAMAKRAEDRYSCAEEMRADLELVEQGHGQRLTGEQKLRQKALSVVTANKKKRLVWQLCTPLLVLCIGTGAWWTTAGTTQSNTLFRQASGIMYRDPERTYSLLTEALSRNRKDKLLNESGQKSKAEHSLMMMCLKTKRYAQATPTLTKILKQELEAYWEPEPGTDSVNNMDMYRSKQELEEAIGDDSSGWQLVSRCLPKLTTAMIERSENRLLLAELVSRLPVKELDSVTSRLPSVNAPNSDLTFLYAVIAKAFLQVGLDDNARDYLRKAESGADEPTLLIEAGLYARLRDGKEAKRCLARLKPNPDKPADLLNIASIYVTLNDYDAAKHCLSIANPKPDNADISVGMTSLCANGLHDNDAARRYLTMAKPKSEDTESLLNMAEIYTDKLKDSDEAQHCLDMARPKPDDANGWLRLGDAYAALYNHDAARHCLAMSRPKPDDAAAFITLAGIYARRLLDNDAARRYLAMAKPLPNDAAKFVSMAGLYAQFLKDQDAARHCLTLAKPKPDDADTWVRMAKIYAEGLKDSNAARHCLTMAKLSISKPSPGDTSALVRMAEIYASCLNDTDAARRCLAIAKPETGDTTNLVRMANIYAKELNDSVAARQCLAVAKPYPGDTSNLVWMADIYARELKANEAAKQCLAMAKPSPGDTSNLVLMAMIYAEPLKDHAAARQCLAMAKPNPGETDNNEAARQCLAIANPRSSDKYDLLGMAHIYAGFLKDSDAARRCLAMVKPDVGDTANLVWMAEIYARDLKDNDAARRCLAMTKPDPGDTATWVRMAEVYENPLKDNVAGKRCLAMVKPDSVKMRLQKQISVPVKMSVLTH